MRLGENRCIERSTTPKRTPCPTYCEPTIDGYDGFTDEPGGRSRPTGRHRVNVLRRVGALSRADLPFGAFVLVITGLILLAIQFPGSPPHAYLAGTDPAISVSGTVIRSGIELPCFDDLARQTTGSPRCNGVLINVTSSSDRHEVPIGTSLAVTTARSYEKGSLFTGATPRSSPQNALGTILILGLLLLICGLAGALIHVLRRRAPPAD